MSNNFEDLEQELPLLKVLANGLALMLSKLKKPCDFDP